MIIGNGLLASAFSSYFADDSNVIVFASGVSNSRENSNEAFLREKEKLLNTLNDGRFLIYFGTCSVNDPTLADTPYVLHKKEMERLICLSQDYNYAIFRLPQVVGKSSNPATLTNYLYQKIMSGDHFQVWRYARRNLIDVDDITLIAKYLYQAGFADKMTINVACPFSVSVVELVSVFESVLEKKANFTLLEAGDSYTIEVNLAMKAAEKIGLKFDGAYIENIIRKYYGSTPVM